MTDTLIATSQRTQDGSIMLGGIIAAAIIVLVLMGIGDAIATRRELKKRGRR